MFRLDRAGVLELAVRGTELCRRLAEESDSDLVFQYSPESFHHTELDYALEICEAVAATWEPTPDAKMIVNLPTTVEHFPPNVYADRMEWFGRNFSRRDSALLSVHPHNDRGTAVATAELGLMAGADRVEGTLFGNGERTGNVDLITIALNLFTQGIDPELDLSQLDEAKQIVEECNELPVHPRHPWAGELVYTAFSGSHQDAIKKGMRAQERSGSELWDVPYLPIDPADVGRTYEAIIRVNSQSGKGGVAYLLLSRYGLDLPRGLQIEFAQRVQAITDAQGGELRPRSSTPSSRTTSAWRRRTTSRTAMSRDAGDELVADLRLDGEPLELSGEATGRSHRSCMRSRPRSGSRSACSTITSTRSVEARTRRPPLMSRETSTARSSGGSESTRASSPRRCAPWSTRSTAASPRGGAGSALESFGAS